MGILNKTELEKAFDYVGKNGGYKLTLEDIKRERETLKNDELLAEIICKIVETNKQYDIRTNYDNLIVPIFTFVNHLYPQIVKSGSDIPLFTNLCTVLLRDRSLNDMDLIRKIYFAYNDKTIIGETLDYLRTFAQAPEGEEKNRKNNIDHILGYLCLAREYYVDDRALFSAFINLVNKVGKEAIIFGTTDEIDKFIEEKLREDKRANGDYDIDQATLEEFSRKLESLGVRKEQLQTLIDLAGRTKTNLEDIIASIEREIKDAGAAQLKEIKEAGTITAKGFDTKYEELLNKERKGLMNERDSIVKELERIVDEKSINVQAIVDRVQKAVEEQIGNLTSTATREIDRITDFVKTDGNVRKIIEEQKNSEELLELLNKFKDVAPQLASASGTPGNSTQIVVPGPSLVDDNASVDYTVNYYFDKSYKFKERFKQIMDKKAKLESQGEIFHKKFDDVVIMHMQNEAPYLWGPSGCGKTYMIEEQFPKLFGTNIVTGGFITFENDVLGFVNVGNGIYVPSVFYRAYKFGDTMFYDEIDKSNANGVNVLLPFMNRSKNQKHTFPNGITIPRHPNFRIITAGNTRLTGSTEAYNTSKKLDESINQRVMFVHVGYDNRIEASVLKKDYEGWYEFCVNFRNALEKSGPGSIDEENSLGTITSRDAQSIKDHLDDGSFNDKQIMEYHVIENKEADYLFEIKNNLEAETFETKEGKKLLKLFNQMVEPKLEAYNEMRD
ncbi:MAG: AAA family ATPase [Erysipelotrichales bacterium]|nr:AAA family ATPase [Erysipelotrichales bacterium]